MGETMKIAVLVPVYNAEKYLRECLDSILTQEGVTLSVFCCNDGSTDGSESILSEYVARYPNVQFVTQKNAGVSAARNRLLNELPEEFDFYAFVDADDYIAPGMYACLSEAAERTGADVIECGGAESERIIDDCSIFLLRQTAPGPWINVINKLYRRSVTGAVRFRKGLAFEEDFFYNYEVNAEIRRKVIVSGNFYTYRRNPDSATKSLNLRRYLDSAAERIRLSCAVFANAGRIPADKMHAFRAELAKDAVRMMIRKNLRKNRNVHERRDLFLKAGALLAELEHSYGFRAEGLDVLPSLLYRLCRSGHYLPAFVLSFFI